MKPTAITPDLLQDYVAHRLDAAANERIARTLGRDRAAARQAGALGDTLALMQECVPAPEGAIPAEWIAILKRRH